MRQEGLKVSGIIPSDIASTAGSQSHKLDRASTVQGCIKKGMIYAPAHGDMAFTVPLFDELHDPLAVYLTPK